VNIPYRVMNPGNTEPSEIHSMDVDVSPYWGSLSSTIPLHRDLVIRVHLAFELLEWRFGYIGRMHLRRLVRGGEKLTRGIPPERRIGSRRIVLAIYQYSVRTKVVEHTGGSLGIPVGPVLIVGSTQFDLGSAAEHMLHDLAYLKPCRHMYTCSSMLFEI
jgi:hypothetical protein